MGYKFVVVQIYQIIIKINKYIYMIIMLIVVWRYKIIIVRLLDIQIMEIIMIILILIWILIWIKIRRIDWKHQIYFKNN